MMLKVCGLKYETNIEEVLSVTPDFIGHIFYKKSPRYIDMLDPRFVKKIAGVRKVGVFVNASVEEILQAIENYRLDFVQLHGDESLEMIRRLCDAQVKIIKVFRISKALPNNMDLFAPYSSHFLFDTQTSSYGGSGEKFDWTILREVSHPFFISGGIDLDDIEAISQLNFKNLVGIDVNSRFELSPGLKDINKIRKLKKIL